MTMHSQFSLRDIYQALFRHKQKALLCFLTIMAATAGYVLFMPRVYQSEAKLFLRLGRENVSLDPTATMGQASIVAIPTNRDNEINSVVEILQSRVMLEKVVAKLGTNIILEDDSAREPKAEQADSPAEAATGNILAKRTFPDAEKRREKAIYHLSKNLSIKSVKKSALISVTYEASTPALAHAVVESLVNFYQDQHISLNRTEGAHEFLSEQTDQVREKLLVAEAELRDLKNRTGLVSPDDQRVLLVKQISELEKELLDTQSLLTSSIAEVELLRESFDGLSKIHVIGRTTGLTNRAEDEARQQLYNLQFKEQELLSKYTEDHFLVVEIRNQIAAAKKILRRDSGGGKGKNLPAGKLSSDARLKIISEEPVLASLSAKESALREQLETAQKQLMQLNKNELLVKKLQREVDLLDENYRKYATNLEQARIDHSLETQRISNISIAQAASYNVRPVRPRPLVSLVLGFAAAVLCSLALTFALDMSDHSIKSAEDIETKLDLPTLVTIPQTKRMQTSIHGANGTRTG